VVHQLELLQTIPGVGEKVAQVIIAETGADMTRFPTPEHLASWAGVSPGTRESAGKRYPVRPPHGNKWLTAMLVEAAGSVGRMKGKNYLAAQHARLTSRRGMARAQLAVGHSILVSAYWMLTPDQPYHDLGPEWLARRNDEAHARRLVAQLERLGHTWSSTRSPDLTPQEQRTGFARPALTRACNSPIHGSVILCDLDRCVGG
jgi:transposase